MKKNKDEMRMPTLGEPVDASTLSPRKRGRRPEYEPLIEKILALEPGKAVTALPASPAEMETKTTRDRLRCRWSMLVRRGLAERGLKLRFKFRVLNDGIGIFRADEPRVRKQQARKRAKR